MVPLVFLLDSIHTTNTQQVGVEHEDSFPLGRVEGNIAQALLTKPLNSVIQRQLLCCVVS